MPTVNVAMIRRFLAFWREHRDVLLDGRIRPSRPQHAYPVVTSETAAKTAVAADANGFAPLPEVRGGALVLFNGTLGGRMVLEVPDELGECRIRIWSCIGECLLDEAGHVGAGLHSLPITPAGTAVVCGQGELAACLDTGGQG